MTRWQWVLRLLARRMCFLFAIVGIIALSTGLYGETGRVILFAGTILVIGLIVITFLRWI